MKKIVCTALVAFSLIATSCKESTKKEVNSEMNEAKAKLNEVGNDIENSYNNAKKDVARAFKDIKIPEFDDERAEVYLKDYANHIEAKMNAGIEDVKNSEFAKETNEFAERSKAFMSSLDDKAQKQFNETKAKIDAKWDEWKTEAEKELEN
jgi:hypothetical protein